MQVFAYKMCNFFKKVFQCPLFGALFSDFSCIFQIFVVLLHCQIQNSAEMKRMKKEADG